MAWDMGISEETSSLREVQTGTARKQWAKPSIQTIDLHAAQSHITAASPDATRPSNRPR